jgi:hypothetical protein
MTGIFSQIVKRLGTVKNEILVFAILTAIIIHVVGATLSHTGVLWKDVAGVAMHFIGVIWLVGVGVFYVYAALNLPSSDQELIFADAAERTLRQHARRRLRT